MVIWKDFRPPYVLEAVWVEYIQQVMSDHFMRQQQFDAENQNMQIHDSLPRTLVDSFCLFHMQNK